jgi:cyclophilin family peptidyl-prolyl cis-trans isomerase
MTVRSPRTLLALAASTAVLLAACSSGGATPAPTKAPASADQFSAAPSASAAASVTASSAPSSGASSSAAGAPDLSGCPTAQPAPLGATDTRTVTLTTPKGDIVIKVDGKNGPIATGNFIALASCGYYDNVVFHRLVPGFVIQAGDGQYGRAPQVDPNHVGEGGPGYTIKDEAVVGDYVRGVVAMARTPQPISQGSQFFICLADLRQDLDKAGGYVILGTVTKGMDVVDAIAAEPNSGPPANQANNPEPMTKVTVATP